MQRSSINTSIATCNCQAERSACNFFLNDLANGDENYGIYKKNEKR